MISQEEMKKYFIHANCHALKSGFKHEFHETTYFKPTYCAHCTGLVSISFMPITMLSRDVLMLLICPS